jgi:hypothetical protein
MLKLPLFLVFTGIRYHSNTELTTTTASKNPDAQSADVAEIIEHVAWDFIDSSRSGKLVPRKLSGHLREQAKR